MLFMLASQPGVGLLAACAASISTKLPAERQAMAAYWSGLSIPMRSAP